MLMRNDIYKFGLSFEKSTDLENWSKLSLLWNLLRVEDYAGSLSRYSIPMIEDGDLPGFYRIRHEDYNGIQHGSFPLKEGFPFKGNFNDGLPSDGPARYDFWIENFGSSQPMFIEIGTNYPAPLRIQLIDVASDIITYDAVKDSLDLEPFKLVLQPKEDQPNGIRVESTQWEFSQTFWIKAGFKFDTPLKSPGTPSHGVLTEEDISYRRDGHYADYESYLLFKDTNYKLEMTGETLDPVFYLKNRLENELLFEVDNETPGKPEIFLFRPEENMELDIIVSSWYPEDTGEWLLNVDPYSEPESITLGETVTGFGTLDDEERIQGESKFYFDWYSLRDVYVEDGITVLVRGREGYKPQFAVTNDTTKKTVFQDRIDCSVRSFHFIPEPGDEYKAVIISNRASLGKNYELELLQGHIFSDNDPNEENSKGPINQTPPNSGNTYQESLY